MHHLTGRQRPAVPQMIVHQIHCLDEVAKQRNVDSVKPRQCVNVVEVLRVRHLVIVQWANVVWIRIGNNENVTGCSSLSVARNAGF